MDPVASVANSKTVPGLRLLQTRIKGRFIVRADEKRTAFLELLHVLLSAQIQNRPRDRVDEN